MNVVRVLKHTLQEAMAEVSRVWKVDAKFSRPGYSNEWLGQGFRGRDPYNIAGIRYVGSFLDLPRLSPHTAIVWIYPSMLWLVLPTPVGLENVSFSPR